MLKNIILLASIINTLIMVILFCNVFDGVQYYLTGQGIVLNIVRFISAYFVLLSEIPPLKYYYLKKFRFYMFPFSRALTYFFFSIMVFSLSWYGIISTVILGIFAIITFITCFYVVGDESPYIPKPNPNLNGNPSRLAAFGPGQSYQTFNQN